MTEDEIYRRCSKMFAQVSLDFNIYNINEVMIQTVSFSG